MGLPAFDVGDLIRVGNHSGTNDDGTARDPFKDASGADTDPTSVVLQVRKPDGSTINYGWPSAGDDGTLTRESIGRFYFDVSITASSTWSWRLAGAGAVQSAEEGSFYVRSQRIP